jgi:hypothetical protein
MDNFDLKKYLVNNPLLEKKLTPKEQAIVDDILGSVNSEIDESLKDAKNKMKQYAKKGLLTTAIITAVCGTISCGKDILEPLPSNNPPITTVTPVNYADTIAGTYLGIFEGTNVNGSNLIKKGGNVKITRGANLGEKVTISVTSDYYFPSLTFTFNKDVKNNPESLKSYISNDILTLYNEKPITKNGQQWTAQEWLKYDLKTNKLISLEKVNFRAESGESERFVFKGQ